MTDEKAKRLEAEGFQVHGRFRGSSGTCYIIASKRSERDYGERQSRSFLAWPKDVHDVPSITLRFTVTRSAADTQRIQRLIGDLDDYLLHGGLFRIRHALRENDLPGQKIEIELNTKSSDEDFVFDSDSELRVEHDRVRQEVLERLWRNRYEGLKRTKKDKLEEAVCTTPQILDGILARLEKSNLIQGAYSGHIRIEADGETELERLRATKPITLEQHGTPPVRSRLMTPGELRTILEQGRETPGTEFKSAGSRTDREFLVKVVKAVLALANRRGGGIIVIGVDDDGGRITPTGLSDDELETWTPETVSGAVAAYADPFVDLSSQEVLLDGLRFVVLEVIEFEEVPILCKRGFAGVLREGACYVRRRGRIESCEIPNHAEMRELIDLAAEKSVRRFFQTARRTGIVDNQVGIETDDEELFQRQLERDQ